MLDGGSSEQPCSSVTNHVGAAAPAAHPRPGMQQVCSITTEPAPGATSAPLRHTDVYFKASGASVGPRMFPAVGSITGPHRCFCMLGGGGDKQEKENVTVQT